NPEMPGLRFATNRTGTEEILEYFQDIALDWELVDLKIHHITAQDDRVIAYGTGQWKHNHTRRLVTTDKVDIFRIVDGKIVEFTELFDTAAVVAAATDS
ncbi:MAG: nuclear transport factor 2 family protein, partial [Planctomycetota bacterium]